MKGKFRINHLKIKELIGEKKMTIDGFADKMGIARNSVYAQMAKDVVSIDVAERMAAALGVELNDIKATQPGESEFIGFAEIKEMYNNIIASHLETIKSLQRSVENLSMALGKRRVVKNLSRKEIIPLLYNQAA